MFQAWSSAPVTEDFTMNNAESAMQNGVKPNEYLTFRLGVEEYGIDILKVQEIRGYDAVTRVSGAPDFVKGVINLRGVIVPVVDLRVKFSLGDVRYDAFTVVVILNLGGRVVGVVVDSVSDVLELATEQVRPAPDFECLLSAGFVTGLGTVASKDGERMLILLDIGRMMMSPEMGIVADEETLTI
jgi:purine-binding chemotaxis protein CheW